MRKEALLVGIVLVCAFFIGNLAEEKAQQPDKNFYENSLHFTNRGLEYWYSKDQGGLERITGIPFSELPCGGCHVQSCDTCHKKETNGKAAYSLEPARAQEVCQNCHNLETLEEAKKNLESATADVHFKKGMKCMDCHYAREIHGDGTAYSSIQQPGAMDTRCENCHTQISECESHEIHGNKVDCNACHIRDLPSCYNCHFDTRVKEGKSVSLPLKNLLFLINHDGKVTLGNLHTFVYQNKTMITFAPSFPHSIMKEGRKCEDCHNTQVINDVKNNKLNIIKFENGEIKSISGVIPVLEGLNWNFVFLNYENGKWIPIEKPAEPLTNYAGYSSPLTREQLIKLEKALSTK